MPSPFPGMDPYLETPNLWPDVHHRIISEIQSALNPVLLPRYVARVELRIYVSDEDDAGRSSLRIPDVRIERTAKHKRTKKTPNQSVSVAIAEPLTIPLLIDDEIEEARLEIRHRESSDLVTVIEVLSPSNKVRGSDGRVSFMAKRREILRSEVHWVEIDLLREGDPSVARLARAGSDYRIVVSRGEDHRHGKYWPVSVRQPLPVIGIPLRGKDPDAPLDLNAVLRAAYDNAAYGVSIDYRRDPEPPLSRADAAWAAKLLREHKLR
jgi:hypothetical protein